MTPAGPAPASRLPNALRLAPWLDRRRALGYATILGAFELALVLFWVLGARDNVDPLGKALGTDFISFWSASQLALQGTPAFAYDSAAHAAAEAGVAGPAAGYFSFFYPPVFLLVCLPLALLPYALSLPAWLGATAAPALAVMRRLLPGFSALELAAAATFPALLLNAGHGQNGFLSLALVGFGFLALARRPVLAGVLLGCLVYKPQLAVLLPFALACAGHWRALAAAAMTAALLAVLSWLVLGGGVWSAFFAQLGLATDTLSQSLVDPAKMVTLFAALRLWGLPAGIALGAQIAAALAMLVLTARHARAATPLQLGALCVTGTFLATPFALDYDLTLLALPLAVLVTSARRDGFLPWEKLVLLAAFILPLMVRPLGMLHVPAAPLVLVALLALVMARIAGAAGTAAAR